MRWSTSTLLIALLAAGCAVPGLLRVEPSIATAQPEAAGLTLVSWNAQKGRHDRFGSDLARLLRRERPDILFLQEARHDLDLPRHGLMLFASSWRYPWPGGRTVGVLTHSRLPTTRVESLQTRHGELLAAAPKTSLVSEHLLSDGSRLLAANVHLLNFQRFSTHKMGRQLEDVAAQLRDHEGPVLIAGDFNVWSRERLGVVEDMARESGLREVGSFPPGRRTADLGPLTRIAGVDPALPLDRVYYRGLRPLEANVLPYSSSDHPPIRVRFALAPEASRAHGPGVRNREVGVDARPEAPRYPMR